MAGAARTPAPLRRHGRRAQMPRGGGGFSLVEVLVACALLAIALVPALRSLNASSRMAAQVEGACVRSIQAGDAAAREERGRQLSSAGRREP